MKRILLLLIISASLAACAHNLSDPKVVDGLARNALNENQGRYPGHGFSGWSKSTYENGQLEKLAHYLDGKFDGAYINWRENGEKSLEASYKRGELVNSVTWKANEILVEAQVSDGYGLMVSYHDNNSKSSAIFHQGGHRQKEAKWWYDNDQMSQQTYYKDGKKSAIETRWYRNGDQSAKHNFIDGKLNGIATQWHQGGSKLSEVSYLEGEYHGPFNRWYKNGTKSYQAVYDNNKLINAMGWKPDGSNSETKVLNGSGVTVSYYENGQKSSERFYKKSRFHGVSTWWYENGQKSSEISFKRGARRGVSTWWNENGEQKRVITYENNRPINDQSALEAEFQTRRIRDIRGY